MVVLVFAAIWAKVLVGTSVLIGADNLYGFLPWSATSGAHGATNILVLDPIREFVPWLGLVQRALAAGHLPLWNPYAMSGKPLLADYGSAVFSPFTLVAAGIGGTAWGYSIAMLAKMWVAGLGMVLYLRLLGVRPAGAALGAISYGTCSYVVVWLAWPHSSVAALLPWSFAAVEWHLRRPSRAGIGAVALVVALQFFAGHAESSIVLAEGLLIYAACRCFDARVRRGRGFIGLIAAAILGSLAAAVQILPFLQQMLTTSLGSFHRGVGLSHLAPSAISSWIIPNLHGNPGIDGQFGRPPHYNESTGFAGVAALVLSMIGAVYPRRWRTARVGLVLIGLFATAIVYGLLTPFIGSLPLLKVTRNTYMVMLICFAIASLAGMGLDALSARPMRQSTVGAGALVFGMAGLATTGALTLAFVILKSKAERLVPPLPPALHGGMGFWALLGGASLLAASSLALAMWCRGGRPGLLASILVLALLESGVFAGAYEPQISVREALPPSAVMRWLAANSGSQRVAAVGYSMIPETATLYRITDVRGYDVVRPAGMKRFWSLADPNYYDDGLFATLFHPQANWLAAAGVAYIITSGNQPLPGTTSVYRREGVTVGAVPGVRSFVFAAPYVNCADSKDAAASSLHTNGPLGAVVLETSSCPNSSAAEVRSASPRPERVDIAVLARAPTVVVVLQSNSPDWRATVDGRHQAILPADLQFQAIAVPAGRHTVTLTYSPPAVQVGLAGSAVAMTIIFFLLLSDGLSMPRRSQTNSALRRQSAKIDRARQTGKRRDLNRRRRARGWR